MEAHLAEPLEIGKAAGRCVGDDMRNRTRRPRALAVRAAGLRVTPLAVETWR